MKNIKYPENERLTKIICIRLTVDDYKAISDLSKAKRSDVSKLIRKMTQQIVDLVDVNNGINY